MFLLSKYTYRRGFPVKHEGIHIVFFIHRTHFAIVLHPHSHQFVFVEGVEIVIQDWRNAIESMVGKIQDRVVKNMTIHLQGIMDVLESLSYVEAMFQGSRVQDEIVRTQLTWIVQVFQFFLAPPSLEVH